MREIAGHWSFLVVMRIALGTLAKSGLEARVGPDLPAAINTALVYYVGKLSSGRGPAKFPKFLLLTDEEGSEGEANTEDAATPADRPVVEVDVDERIEAALFSDAERQGVSPTDLAGHAVMIYLAELDLLGDPDPTGPGRIHALAGPSRLGDRRPH
ncbi:MAG TPA: hypothetical protein VJL81_10870 [Solirubrobacterales bacterium]|nr:hypothetical protein [Solirubrobacterales bacterium]